MFQQQRRAPTYEEFREMYNDDKQQLNQQIRRSDYKILEDLFPAVCQHDDVEFAQWMIKNNPKDKFPRLDINTVLMMATNNEYKMLVALYNGLDYLKNDFDMTNACFNAQQCGNVEFFNWMENIRTKECTEMLAKMNTKK